MKIKFPIEDGQRVCTQCLTKKSLNDDFYLKNGGPHRINSKYMAECKECFKTRMKAFNKANNYKNAREYQLRRSQADPNVSYRN